MSSSLFLQFLNENICGQLVNSYKKCQGYHGSKNSESEGALFMAIISKATFYNYYLPMP